MTILSPVAKMQFLDAAGAPLVGGLVYTYAAGTTTPLNTYTDSSGGTANSNPVVLDSRGEANIWLASTNYKFKLCDSTNTEIWTVDNIAAPISAVSPVFGGNVVISTSSAQAALRVTQTGSGNVVLFEDDTNPDSTPFVIDNIGNVGIGTTSPIDALNVARGAIQLTDGAGARSKISATVSASTYSAEGARSLILRTNSTDQVTVLSDGKVGFGTATPAQVIDAVGSVRASTSVITPIVSEYAVGGGVTVAGVVCKNSQVDPSNRIITASTAVSAATGTPTSIDFTSIPSWVKRITVLLTGVSSNGTSQYLIRLGTASGVETTSYSCVYSTIGASAVGSSSSTAGFLLDISSAAGSVTGSIILNQLTTNVWVCAGQNIVAATSTCLTTGSKTTAATLDRIRLTTVGGTDTFDAGTINIFYE